MNKDKNKEVLLKKEIEKIYQEFPSLRKCEELDE
jgi:hypothetical protein